MRTCSIARADDVAGFLGHLDGLLRDGVSWEEVDWSVGGIADGLMATASSAASSSHRAAPGRVSRLPPSFVDTMRVAALHGSPTRFVLMHRMAQRIAAQPAAWGDTLHPDHVALSALQRQVRREMHKMKAFVRFTKVVDGDGDRFVAWFEPAHAVVRAVAPFFARRFAGMRWAIATPEVSVQWDGAALQFGPGGRREEAPPPDAGEALWLTYYQRIFNPARVKVQAMKKEMPVRYWPLLPEARLIAPLIADAPRRTREMVAQVDGCRSRRVARAVDAGSGVPATPLPALQALQRRASACRECAFSDQATQMVWGEGPADARLMIVGEQPGDREDLLGRPFVGPAGQLLRHALACAGIDAGQAYLTNAVKHFKYEWRGKRRMHKTAAQREAEACAGWLAEEERVVNPDAVLALGVTAASSLLGAPVRLQDVAGQPLHTRHGKPLVAADHPAALLRRQVAVGSAEFERWVAALRSVLAFVREPVRAADEGARADAAGGMRPHAPAAPA